MKVCPKCGSILENKTKKCPSCDADVRFDMVFEKVDTGPDTMEEAPRKHAVDYVMRVLFVLLLSAAVVLVNYYGAFRWYNLIPAVYGALTLLFPQLYFKLFLLFYVKNDRGAKPTDFYFALHILLALAAWVAAVVLPLVL